MYFEIIVDYFLGWGFVVDDYDVLVLGYGFMVFWLWGG